MRRVALAALLLAPNLLAGSQAIATHAALATPSRSATVAGLESLRRGGNAADAAFAVATSLGASGGTLVYYDAGNAAVWALDSPTAVETMLHRFGTQSGTRNDTTRWRAPLRISLGEYDIYTSASSGGLMLAEMLNILAPFELKPNDASTIHLLAEAERRASYDREKSLRSPNPYREMLSLERATQWRASMAATRATPTVTIGEPVKDAISPAPTSHFSVVDAEGNIASVTVAGGEGAIIGAPSILFHQGKPILALGSGGGAAAPAVVLRVILGVMKFGEALDVAIDTPRFDQQAMPEDLAYETSRASADLVTQLVAFGHGVRAQDSIGDVQAVLIAPDRLTAISDSRHSGVAGAL